MKTFLRLVSLGFVAILIPGMILSQHYVPLESLDKNAILEEFTGVNCPNCPAGHQVMAQILADNPGRAFCVAYHPYNSSFTTPYAGDPDFRRHFPDSLYMIPYCGTSRFMPSSFIQRRLWTPPERLMSRTVWATHANTIMAEPSPMNVGMATSYDPGTSVLTVVVDIYYTEDFPGDHNLMVTLAENNLVSHQAGGSYPYVHKHTFREAFVGQWGDPILTDADAGTFYTRTFTFDYSATDYIMENCELLAFVIDNASTEVITGIGCMAGDTTFITPDVSLTADTLFFENPQQCLDGQIVTIVNNTDVDLDLVYVQEESSPASPFMWSVDPWPFTGFPHTLAPDESVDLNIVIPLPTDARMQFLYDDLMLISEIDTQYVTIAVNEGLYTGIGDPATNRKSTLSMNYPNPFSTSTTIEYAVAKPVTVVIEVYDVNGQKVKTLVDAPYQAGIYKVTWNGTNDAGQQLPGGIYLYRLKTPDVTLTRRCVLLR
ncbi:MAG: Omp28-related outer membrane protein [Bacteroidales bacterium]|nr:Omp28-related outer membrane protein [Bacteroidales bacterium]